MRFTMDDKYFVIGRAEGRINIIGTEELAVQSSVSLFILSFKFPHHLVFVLHNVMYFVGSYSYSYLLLFSTIFRSNNIRVEMELSNNDQFCYSSLKLMKMTLNQFVALRLIQVSFIADVVMDFAR